MVNLQFVYYLAIAESLMRLRMLIVSLFFVPLLFAGQVQSPGTTPQKTDTSTTSTTASLSEKQITQLLRLKNDWAQL
jgi:hypothetical protein